MLSVDDIELEQAQRVGDLAKAGELSYGRIPELDRQLEEAKAQSENAMLREVVTEIATTLGLT